MRDPQTGQSTIDGAIESLRKAHELHIINYGAGLAERLTGLHETCHINEFRSGRSDRGASIRVPAQVANDGYGYIEDRRPAANCDPYLVSALLVNTICELGVNLFEQEKIPALA
jgi:glutamine synthetase